MADFSERMTAEGLNIVVGLLRKRMLIMIEYDALLR